jgi:hypothetical protein
MRSSIRQISQPKALKDLPARPKEETTSALKCLPTDISRTISGTAKQSTARR